MDLQKRKRNSKTLKFGLLFVAITVVFVGCSDEPKEIIKLDHALFGEWIWELSDRFEVLKFNSDGSFSLYYFERYDYEVNEKGIWLINDRNDLYIETRYREDRFTDEEWSINTNASRIRGGLYKVGINEKGEHLDIGYYYYEGSYRPGRRYYKVVK
jgi:hypothetical protein